MKVRIKGNSIRYRLSKTDVAKFINDGYLAETTSFCNAKLTYAIERTSESKLSAIFSNETIKLSMPVQMAMAWEATDRVGFEGYDGELFILIEKDFQCLDNVAEDQSDNYPNPNGC